jgi:hypothetical protein
MKGDGQLFPPSMPFKFLNEIESENLDDVLESCC